MGTASLYLAQVAAGHYGAFFEYELLVLGFATGRLLVEEAGGHVTTCHGNRLPLGNSSVRVCHTRLSDAMWEISSRHHPQNSEAGRVI